MELSHFKEHEAIIADIVSFAEEKLSKSQVSLVKSFIKSLYRYTSIDDLRSRPPLDWFGMAVTFWHFIDKRAGDESKIQIFNPDFERNGWESSHTILQICSNDMPFLVDSIGMALERLGYTIHLVIHLGGVGVERNEKGAVTQYHGSMSKQNGNHTEAVIQFEIDKQTDPQKLAELEKGVRNVLRDVTQAVEDWPVMNEKIDGVIEKLACDCSDKLVGDIKEAQAFLNWLKEDNFTFLGYREYDMTELDTDKGKTPALRLVNHSSLGVVRNDVNSKVYRPYNEMPDAVRDAYEAQAVIIISKTNTLATVHRPTYTDCLDIIIRDKNCQLTNVYRFIGLFTSRVYYFQSPDQIPFLRKKFDDVMNASNLPKGSHAWKALYHILQTLPRDDLFQMDAQSMLDYSMGILDLQERKRISLFMHPDIYNRFYSCLVYVPREIYHMELREAVGEILMRTLGGIELTFSTLFSDSVLARIHFMIRVDSSNKLEYDQSALENEIRDIGRTWNDELHAYLLENYGEEKATVLWRDYRKAFSTAYREEFTPRTAVYDIAHLEEVRYSQDLSISLFTPLDDRQGKIRFKLFHPNRPIPLSDVLPILENMGLRILAERPHKIVYNDSHIFWLNDFGMEGKRINEFDISEIGENFQDAFRHIWYGDAENDGFNELVIVAKLNWREVAMLRAYNKYMRQIGFTFSQEYIEDTLASNPIITNAIVGLFKARFEPDRKSRDQIMLDNMEQEIIKLLETVANLDQDRIVRKYVECIKATLRTNFYQVNDEGACKPYISFKLNPSLISDMPKPLPAFEIFVYATRFEGVHLRGAKVARGGLRWSDRREDFRTEVLGLMKAQQVKNALIVPSGAKGGFVPKLLPAGGTRDETMAEVVGCYKNFIRGLLDVSDNLRDGEVIHPSNVVRYDEDDPYLVVAADKGTATFSDIANGISQDYGFWLDDAFASGGSTGYDHKKMGITARGAWESVKRHFRELGHNTQEQPFTVIGIGDMGGDVFGNGMLLSEQIQLVGAFNHMHIFLDPNPDPAKSFVERQRLFELPRSSWEDYSAELISEGGGIFKRSAKSIPLSPQIRKLLGTDKTHLEPNQVIRLMLKAKIDCLWNGGIGTYVKASHETHLQVGDRANDSLRIDGKELGCRVIGEGGNLGFTQSARVEFALNGGHVYTDFIDNSAGVDCSDHEVNIKILLNDIVSDGELTEKQRNQLLAQMTDEVATLVLENNYLQTEAISIATHRARIDMELYRRFINGLVARDEIDLQLEHLPDEAELANRKTSGQGLTGPEMSVLFAYSKNLTRDKILESDLTDDAYLVQFVSRAFPKVITERYTDYLKNHKLRKEIIATQIGNILVNDMGIIFPRRLMEETGAPLDAIVRAYMISRDVYGMPDHQKLVRDLDYNVESKTQYEMIIRIIRQVRRATRWFIRNRRDKADIQETVDFFKADLNTIRALLPDLLIGSARERFDKIAGQLVEAKVPKELANQIAGTGALLSALDIIEVAKKLDKPIEKVARVYFEVGEYLHLDWFREQINAFLVQNHWEALARVAHHDDLDWQQRELAASVLMHEGEYEDERAQVAAWAAQYQHLSSRWEEMCAHLKTNTNFEIVMFSVALRELLDLTQSCSINIDNHATAQEQDAKASQSKPKKAAKEAKSNSNSSTHVTEK